MDATNATLLWDPKSGDVLLRGWPEKDGNYWDYRSTLACCTAMREADFKQRQAMVFIEAMHLIVRDGIDPKRLHDVLLELDEYREACSHDIPGNKTTDRYYSTEQAAKRLCRQPHTLRLYYHAAGEAYNIKPVKVGSRLHWPKDQVDRVARGLSALEAA